MSNRLSPSTTASAHAGVLIAWRNCASSLNQHSEKPSKPSSMPFGERCHDVVLDVAVDPGRQEDRAVDVGPVVAGLVTIHPGLEADDPDDLVRRRGALDDRPLLDLCAHAPQPLHVEDVVAVVDERLPFGRLHRSLISALVSPPAAGVPVEERVLLGHTAYDRKRADHVVLHVLLDARHLHAHRAVCLGPVAPRIRFRNSLGKASDPSNLVHPMSSFDTVVELPVTLTIAAACWRCRRARGDVGDSDWDSNGRVVTGNPARGIGPGVRRAALLGRRFWMCESLRSHLGCAGRSREPGRSAAQGA